MIHLLRQVGSRLVYSGPLVDRAQVRSVVGLLAMISIGCSFEVAASDAQPFENADTGTAESSSTSTGGTSSGPSAGTTSTLTSQGESDPPDESVSSGTPTSSTSSSAESEGTAEDETGETSGSEPVDCTIPITLSQSADEATLFKPMQLGTFQGSPYAFSLNEGAGAVRFTFDVACPSTYRLFGRVRDDDPGTHSCCDPDSFNLDGPGGLQHTWFYGCDTSAPGWTWAQVEAGESAPSCAAAAGIMVPLAAGTHEFTLRNREPAQGGAHAGISELVLTNDPAYQP